MFWVMGRAVPTVPEPLYNSSQGPLIQIRSILAHCVWNFFYLLRTGLKNIITDWLVTNICKGHKKVARLIPLSPPGRFFFFWHAKFTKYQSRYLADTITIGLCHGISFQCSSLLFCCILLRWFFKRLKWNVKFENFPATPPGALKVGFKKDLILVNSAKHIFQKCGAMLTGGENLNVTPTKS